MSRISPTFQDYQQWGGRPRLGTNVGVKDFSIRPGKALHNIGYYNTGTNSRMKSLDTDAQFMKQIQRIFNEYKRNNGKPVYTGVPAKDLIAYQKWMQRAKKYIQTNQKKEIPWNFRSFGDLAKEESKPRKTAKPSSSWLKHIRLNGNVLTVNLGGKEYDYFCPDHATFQKFISSPSMGSIIAKISGKNKAPGTSFMGISKLPF